MAYIFSLHTHITDILFSAEDMFATPELMRLVFKKKSDILSALSAEDKLVLLEYLLSDSKYDDMIGKYPLTVNGIGCLVIIISGYQWRTVCDLILDYGNFFIDMDISVLRLSFFLCFKVLFSIAIDDK